jgi:uncharacterized lipoprotein YajG
MECSATPIKYLKIVLAAGEDFRVVEPRMKKLIAYLAIMFGLVSVGLVTGCQKQSETTPGSPSTNAPAVPPTPGGTPSTNGM